MSKTTDNQSNDISTTNTTEGSNQQTNKKNKRILTIASISSIGVVTLLLIGLIPVSGQSLISRTLDSLGNHKASATLDSFSRLNSEEIGLNALVLANYSDKEVCKNLQSNISDTQFGLRAISGEATTKSRPINPDYADKLSLDSHFEGTLNIEKNEFFGGANITANIDFDTVNQIFDEYYQKNNTGRDNSITDYNDSNYNDSYSQSSSSTSAPSQFSDWGMTTVNFNGKVFLTRDIGGLTIHSITVENNAFSSSNKLNKWYTQDLQLEGDKETKKDEAINDITDVVLQQLYFKPSEIFNSTTIGIYTEALCSIVDSVDAEKVSTITFGSEGSTQTKKVRPIVIKLKNNYLQTLLESLPKLSTSIKNDDVTKQYLKDQYSEFVKFGQAIYKLNDQIYGTSSPNDINIPTQEEYNKEIDELFESIGSEEELRDGIESLLASFNVDTEVVITNYIDVETGKIYAIKTSSIARLKDLDSNQDLTSTAKKILKDGYLTETIVYNLKFNENVKNIEIPSNTSTLNELQNDSSNLDIIRRINTPFDL